MHTCIATACSGRAGYGNVRSTESDHTHKDVDTRAIVSFQYGLTATPVGEHVTCLMWTGHMKWRTPNPAVVNTIETLLST